MYNDNLFEPYQGFIRGNMFKNIFDQYGKIYEIKPINEQAELLTYIDMFDFACIDLSLYLDIFPNNKQIINLYNQIKKEKNSIVQKYENNFGPLMINSSGNDNYWLWVNSPWPWEV